MLRTTKVENGLVKGLAGEDPRITVYRGIPFAKPPVGENRFRAPQPCDDWDGTLEAYDFGPISYQDTPGIGGGLYDREWHVDPEIPISTFGLLLKELTKSSQYLYGTLAAASSGATQQRWNLTEKPLPKEAS